MQLSSVYFLALYELLSCLPTTESLNIRFLKINNCRSSNSSIVVFEACAASESKINASLFLMVPIDKFYIQLAFFKKEGNDYHQFFRIPPLEWCGLMAGAKSNNRLTRPIVASLKELMPQIVKPCPFQGKMEIYDLSLGRKSLFNMYPTGVFRVEFKAFQTDPDCTITGNVWIEVMN